MHSSPYGAAGGALKGAYPNPTLIVEEGNLQLSARVFDQRAAAFATQLSPGLSVWNSGVNRATPNATIAVHWLAPNTGATNADAAIIPRSNGAFLLAIPDNTAAGGNKRGLRAVDLSRNRSANTAVAAATDSFAAGTDITIATTATGACGLGTGLTLNGVSSFCSGQGGIADGDYSTALGRSSRSRGVIGALTLSSGTQSTAGDRQFVIFSGRILTTDAATTVVITANGSGTPSVTNTWALANNSCATFVAYITGHSGSAGAAAWEVKGLVYKDGAGTTTVVLDAASPHLIASRGTGSATTATVAANTVNDTPEMRVTGFAPATNGSWFGVLILTEVVG